MPVVGSHEAASEMQAEMISLALTPPFSKVSDWNWLGQKEADSWCLLLQCEMFLLIYTIGILEHLFWPLSGFVYKTNCLVASGSWTVGSVCLLSCHSFRELRDLNSNEVPHCLASTPALLTPAPSSFCQQNCVWGLRRQHRVLVIESSHPDKILKCSRE